MNKYNEKTVYRIRQTSSGPYIECYYLISDRNGKSFVCPYGLPNFYMDIPSTELVSEEYIINNIDIEKSHPAVGLMIKIC